MSHDAVGCTVCNVMREVGLAEEQEFDTAGNQAGQGDEKPTNSSCLILCVLWAWKRTTAGVCLTVLHDSPSSSTGGRAGPASRPDSVRSHGT